jgi:hypothetical protein
MNSTCRNRSPLDVAHEGFCRVLGPKVEAGSFGIELVSQATWRLPGPHPLFTTVTSTWSQHKKQINISVSFGSYAMKGILVGDKRSASHFAAVLIEALGRLRDLAPNNNHKHALDAVLIKEAP